MSRYKNMRKILGLIICLVFLSCKESIKDTKKSLVKKENEKEMFTKSEDLFLNSNDQFKSIVCTSKNESEDFYNMTCDNFEISNSIINSTTEKKVELISMKFKDIDKAIIRNINNSELISSAPNVFKKGEEYVFLFPLVEEYNFGWLLYYYKDYKLYFLGKRILYWNSEYEESKTSYKDFTKIYKKDEFLILVMDSKNIVINNEEYKNYMDYKDGKLFSTKGKYNFEFDLKNISFYKKYDNGNYEGDYNKMINNGIIKPFE